MAESTLKQRILVVGEQVDPEDLEAACSGKYSLEFVDSLEEALEKLATGEYSNLVVLPSDANAGMPPIITPPPLAEVRRQMELLDSILANTRTNLAYLDTRFNFVWVNAAYAEKCGYSQSELVGRHHFDLFPHEENERIFRRVRDSGEPYEAKRKPFVYPDHPERGVTYWDWTLTPVRSRSRVVDGLVLSLVDVTEDVRERQHVEAEHTQFHAVLKQMLAGVIIAEAPSGRVVLANEQVERIWRRSSTPAESIQDYQAYLGFHIEDGRLYEPGEWPLARAITSGKTVVDEKIEFLRGDGVCGTMKVHASPIRDENGAVVAGVAVFEDITEQREAEEELKRYQLFSEHARDIILFVRRDGRIIEANSAALNAYGYSREELLQKTVFELRASDSANSVETQMSLADSHSILFETTHIRKDGTSFPVEVSSQGATIGGERVLLSIVRDISERREAEQALSRAHEETQKRAAELESVMSSMADGLTLVDTDGRILLLNEAGREILGLRPGEHLVSLGDMAARFRMFTLSGEPGGERDMASYRALKGETVRDMQYRMITPTGKEVLIGISASPVRDTQGRIVGATNVFRDETERVRFEERQKELYEREHKIAEVLQKAILPDSEYDIAGCRIAVKYEPALEEAEVGGDFYDVFEIEEGKVGIMIGDVAGKGLPAAIRVAAARHTIRSYAYLNSRPSHTLTLANNALSRDHDGSGMLTAFFAVLDTDLGVIHFANGGHEPPILRRADGSIEELPITGRALGAREDYAYQEDSRVLREDDIIVMVTDGITEARDRDRAFFGMEGVRNYLMGIKDVSCEGISEGLLADAKRHADGHLRDDAAVVVFGLSRRQEGRRNEESV